MRRQTQAIGLIILALLLVGCATNPVNRWAQARDGLTRAQDSVRFAHQAGLIDDEKFVASDPIVQATRAALKKSETFLPEGGADFEHYLSIAEAMLDRLILMAVRDPPDE